MSVYSTRASCAVRATPAQTSAHTDTYRGHFIRLVENELVVEALEFETDDPAFAGEMIMTTTITPTNDGAVVEMVHDKVPDAVRRADNEAGMRMALTRLTSMFEAAGQDES